MSQLRGNSFRAENIPVVTKGRDCDGGPLVRGTDFIGQDHFITKGVLSSFGRLHDDEDAQGGRSAATSVVKDALSLQKTSWVCR